MNNEKKPVRDPFTARKLSAALLDPEITYTTSRSGGPGGQNVNKLNTRVTLRFNVAASRLISDAEKLLLQQRLQRFLTASGDLILSSQAKRSQLQNKEAVMARFDRLLEDAFKSKKTRRPSKPTKASIATRIDRKKRTSEKKKWRRKPDL